MADDIGPGHNRRPVFTLRGPRGRGVSCDWTHPEKGGGRPRHFERYWRVLRDGKGIDSFLTKKRARAALRRYEEREGL